MSKRNDKVNYPTSAKERQKWGTLGIAALVVAVLLAPAIGASAQAVKRLILTDGSFQAVAEWKVEGDRVKYLSAERGEWEELPKSLVDWKATDEWNASAAKTQAEELKQMTEEEVAEHKQAAMNTPLVAPKLAPELRLPAEGGVFLLEMQAGKPVLRQLQGVNPQENKHEGANILKRSLIPIPLGQVQTVELQGAAAKVRLHSQSPEIFLDVEDQDGPVAGDNFRLVRLERKHGLRVVATTKTGGLGGEKVTQSFLTSRAEPFSGNWWKLVLLEDLTPGEYAIMIADRGGYRSEVLWDFGVDK